MAWVVSLVIAERNYYSKYFQQHIKQCPNAISMCVCVSKQGRKGREIEREREREEEVEEEEEGRLALYPVLRSFKPNDPPDNN